MVPKPAEGKNRPERPDKKSKSLHRMYKIRPGNKNLILQRRTNPSKAGKPARDLHLCQRRNRINIPAPWGVLNANTDTLLLRGGVFFIQFDI
jgi:hypothetical protein